MERERERSHEENRSLAHLLARLMRVMWPLCLYCTTFCSGVHLDREGHPWISSTCRFFFFFFCLHKRILERNFFFLWEPFKSPRVAYDRLCIGALGISQINRFPKKPHAQQLLKNCSGTVKAWRVWLKLRAVSIVLLGSVEHRVIRVDLSLIGLINRFSFKIRKAPWLSMSGKKLKDIYKHDAKLHLEIFLFGKECQTLTLSHQSRQFNVGLMFKKKFKVW